MTTRLLRLLGLLALLALVATTLSGCGGEARADQPPEIKYGVDTCSRCHMIISEEKYASGLVASDGTTMIFDDIGEMIATVQTDGLNERRVWVHDFDSVEWIDGTTAFYVDSHDLMTPMGMGVVAFSSKDAAEKLAAEKSGTVRDWEAMLVEWEMHGHGH